MVNWNKPCREGVEINVDGTVPFRGGVELHRNDLQSVPGGHAGSIEQTLPTYNSSLTEAEQQQERAGGRHQHGTTWKDQMERHI